MVKINKNQTFDYEKWIPWIIAAIVVIIVFPYDKLKQYFIPKPIEIIKYIEVPVPQYIYIEKPEPQPEPEPEPEKQKEPIVCVFDIDNTITSGIPEKCIKMCKDLNCNLAINTSRDIDNPNDLDLQNLGLTEPHFNKDDYYFNPNAKTSNFEDAAGVKAEHMATIQNRYRITDPKRVILFDDNIININKIRKDGFTGIHVGTKKPGIQKYDIENAFNIINSFT